MCGLGYAGAIVGEPRSVTGWRREIAMRKKIPIVRRTKPRRWPDSRIPPAVKQTWQIPKVSPYDYILHMAFGRHPRYVREWLKPMFTARDRPRPPVSWARSPEFENLRRFPMPRLILHWHLRFFPLCVSPRRGKRRLLKPVLRVHYARTTTRYRRRR